MNLNRISAAEFAQRYQQGMKLIDVRSPAEYGGQHVQGAVNVPLDRLNPGDFCQAYVDSDQDEIYLICQKGGRAAQAAESIGKHTDATLYIVDGGTPDSIAAGAPAASNGKAVMALERQVRIVAGASVLAGCILGATLSPAFYLLAGAFGAGLLFAGITDSCLLGMLLAKMPWNQKE